MSKLRIGISACYFHADPQRPIFKGKTLLYIEQSLAHWVMSGGVLPYMIPSQPAEGTRLEELVSDLDGLVLHGGSDVSPKSYGDQALKPEWNGDYIRDQYELELLKHFRAQRKPVLGVCRGAQLINVGYGGTLVQDIPTELPQAKSHREWQIYDLHQHEVSFERGSWLEKWYPGKPRARINSVHHQALKKLGQGLRVEAWSEPDRVIEAVRSTLPGEWVYAVQWHPEFHDPADPSLVSSAVLLDQFLSQAKISKQGD